MLKWNPCWWRYKQKRSISPLSEYFFHKSRMGMLLAYALMMTIIHQFNNKDEQSRQPIFKPISISASGCEQVDELEKMGIMGSENQKDHTWIQEQGKDNTYIDSTLMDTILYVSLSQFKIYKAMKAHMKTATQHTFKSCVFKATCIIIQIQLSRVTQGKIEEQCFCMEFQFNPCAAGW